MPPRQPTAPRPPNGTTESLLVKAHPGLCEGWGECHRRAPDVFPLDDDGFIDVHLLEVPPELAVRAWTAAQACPIGVISVVGIVGDDVATAPDAGHPDPAKGSP
jgi:ferredoxin